MPNVWRRAQLCSGWIDFAMSRLYSAVCHISTKTVEALAYEEVALYLRLSAFSLDACICGTDCVVSTLSPLERNPTHLLGDLQGCDASHVARSVNFPCGFLVRSLWLG